MKRSEINAIIYRFEQAIQKQGLLLPPFLSFTPEEWKEKGHEYDEIRDNKLGWDITDYGLGDFKQWGLSLITLRNGNRNDVRYTKTYAEKLLFLLDGQHCPMHFHWLKMEDIINRGTVDVCFRLYCASKDGKLLDREVKVSQDGRNYEVPAGEEIVLRPGESLTLYPYYYHEFYPRPGSGDALIGEISMCNDDDHDNCFKDPMGRFPQIEEDEAPYRLLCTEYPSAKG